MGWFDSRDKKERLSKLRNLVMMAKADGVFDEKEKDLLSVIAMKYGLSINEIQRVLIKPDSIDFVPIETNREKVEHLYHLVLVMLWDGKVDDNELALCIDLANVVLGFEINKASHLIKKCIEMIQEGLLDKDATDRLIKEL